MRVLCLVTLPTLGAGNRMRIEQYAPVFREWGIELEISRFFDDDAYAVLYQPGHFRTKAWGVVRGILRRVRDLFRVRRYDLVFLYREWAPLGPPIFERMLRLLGVPYAYDLDDALFLRPIHPANRRWAWLRPTSRVVDSTRLASAVIAGNEYLADWARQRNANVTTIPTVVDTERFVPRPSRRPGGPVVIGWTGSSTTAPYLRLLDMPLEIVASRHDIVFRVIGGNYAHPRVRVEEMAYQLEREPADVATFDIGVLPQPDDEWTRGKGAFKALVYMATGLPVVASCVGVNPEVVLDGETGYCVRSDEEWVEALERLILDPDLRQRLGARGREHVVRSYSKSSQAPRLAQVLRQAARRV